MTHWPFEVTEKEGSPLIKVNYLGEEKTFSPQEISSMVLTKMKEISEAKLGKTVKKAVVTFVFFSSSVPLPHIYYPDLIASLPTSTTLSVLQQKMLVLSLALMFSVSSTNLQPPPLPTVLTDNQKPRKTSSSLTWEEAPSMSPS
jgi:hypothetical protein